MPIQRIICFQFSIIITPKNIFRNLKKVIDSYRQSANIYHVSKTRPERNTMNTYIIDFQYDGFTNFVTVRADSIDKALEIFRNSGVDGWTGWNFKDYEITSIAIRS